jgi:flagellar motor switch/type III secretory pathway protein FliN
MSAAAQATMSPADAQKSREAAARANEKEKKEKEDADQISSQQEEARWRPVLGLPCQLTVDLPLPSFTVADFLGLRPGSVLGTNWRLAHDIPLRINGTLIAWGEFEGAGSRMAVRLTELA